MPQCPNCASNIDGEALECQKCGALFGATSTWQPVESIPTEKPSLSVRTGRRAKSSLVQGVLVALATVIYAVNLLPPLIALFWPFPSLADANRWSGRVEVMWKEPTHQIPAHLYVATPNGKLEFHCGTTFDKRPCPDARLFEGAEGDVWFHPVYGAVQWKLTLQVEGLKGRVAEMPISATRQFYEEYFPYSIYTGKLVVVLAGALLSSWYISRYLRER